jgi:DedD protein
MRLPFFRTKTDADVPPAPAKGRKGATPAGADDGAVQAARIQARRRLIGALVLLAAGVVGFPVLFETQPRPLPVDTPIIVPEGSVVRAVPPVPAASKPLPVLPPDAGAETPVASVAIAASAPALPTPPPVVANSAVPDAKQAPVKSEAPKAAASKPAAKPAAEPLPATAGRFVVQVGAYNDVERLKAARQKLDKLGFKTYTQDVDTAGGKRTRVRVGPFATRQEALAVADKVKAAGMQANVLSI